MGILSFKYCNISDGKSANELVHSSQILSFWTLFAQKVLDTRGLLAELIVVWPLNAWFKTELFVAPAENELLMLMRRQIL